MSTIIFTSQHDPKGRTIRYNVDESTRQATARVLEAYEGTEFVEIPNEDGGDPIFVNPDCITSIAPKKEDDTK